MERNNNSSYTQKRRQTGVRLQGNSTGKCSLQNFVEYNIGQN